MMMRSMMMIMVLVSMVIVTTTALVLPPSATAKFAQLKHTLHRTGDRSLRISLYQGPVMLGQVKANLNLLEQQTRLARVNGSQLIMFPELFTTGYTIFDPVTMYQLAEVSNGPIFVTVAQIAARTGMYILYGYAEKDMTNSSILYDSAQLVSPSGVSLINHRKVELAAGEDMYFHHGTHFGPVVNVLGVNVGVIICFEVSVPEASRALALQRAEVILIPTANGMPIGINNIAFQQVPTRAAENGVYVAYCNFAQSNGTFAFFGMSILVSPGGDFLLTGPGGNEHNATALLTATMSFSGSGPTCGILASRLPQYWSSVCDPSAYCVNPGNNPFIDYKDNKDIDA